MGLLNLTESERLEILNLHNNAKIIKEQAAPVVSAAPTAAPTDDKSKIMAIQTALKTKYKSDLGTSGPNKDGIDGTLGPKTLAALSAAMKSKAASKATPAASTGTATPPSSGTSGTATPAASTTTAPAASTTTAPAASTTTAPAASTTTAPAASTTTAPAASTEVVGNEAPQQLNQTSQQALGGQLTPQQIRQQSRFDQRLARQARRTARRAQQ
jgi:hypothetical protein